MKWLTSFLQNFISWYASLTFAKQIALISRSLICRGHRLGSVDGDKQPLHDWLDCADQQINGGLHFN